MKDAPRHEYKGGGYE